jgi:ADP-dependent NAD(P)H-hydrate dehydratase / NAD(P)H-hydrate epimerase
MIHEMMKIFSGDQIKKIDKDTITNEPVSSVNLMERAALRLFQWYSERFERTKRIFIFTGPGNNGGDGLALARILSENRYEPAVFSLQTTGKTSKDQDVNYQRLKNETKVPFTIIGKSDQFPVISPQDVIVDALFGTGLSRPLEGFPAELINQINNTEALVISIDIPSGLFGEDNSENMLSNIVKADYTMSFQFPRLAFLFSENESYTGDWKVLPIGLSPASIRNTVTQFFYLGKEDVKPLLIGRKKFDHKGIFGHGLLIAGSYGKMGAAVLGAKAALRTGTGLLTCHIPSGGNIIVQNAVPEAMVIPDISEKHISEIGDTELFSAVGIGPGIGTGKETQEALYNLLQKSGKPMVIDADALNILGMNRKWFSLLNDNIILTPHPKEFERLTVATNNSYKRLQNQIEFSKKHNCIVVLKGAYTSISTQEGIVYFNSTGNPGMAKGGSGDVLTGIILSLLAQGYTPGNAAITGVYLHGLAGDIAAEKSCFESFLPSDLINEIGEAFNRIRF